MISLPSQPKIIEKKGNKAIFEIDSLYPGYGVTVGNSLRRVLLSSLPGAAVTQVKIKGVPHEFTTISGVLEDVIMIMLNLKQLRFKLFSEEPQTATLKFKGEKEIKGSDFNLPSQVELINKGCHIAQLTAKSAEIEMEIQIEKGFGYSARETRKKEKTETGAIALDAVFTPIKKVSYRVENMRVGERTDYDRLFLEVETDGTISPEDAIFHASEVLVGHFSLFADAFQPKTPAVKKEKAPVEKTKTKKETKKTKKVKDEKKKKGKKTK